MYYPNYQRLNEEFRRIERETEKPGYMLNLSVNRASVLMDAAYMYEIKGNKMYIPNGNFSDAELSLFEMFCLAFRTRV